MINKHIFTITLKYYIYSGLNIVKVDQSIKYRRLLYSYVALQCAEITDNCEKASLLNNYYICFNYSAPSNYHPISILSVASKLLERHVMSTRSYLTSLVLTTLYQ